MMGIIFKKKNDHHHNELLLPRMDSLARDHNHGKNSGIYIKIVCSYGGSDQSPGLGENGRISHDFTT